MTMGNLEDNVLNDDRVSKDEPTLNTPNTPPNKDENLVRGVIDVTAWAPSTLYSQPVRWLRLVFNYWLMALIFIGAIMFGLWYVHLYKLAQGNIRAAGTNPNGTAAYTAYWGHQSSRVGIWMHLCFGGLWFLLGPFQFVGGLRVRLPRVHRMLGYAFALCQVLSTIGIILVITGPRDGQNGGFGSNLFVWLWGIYWNFCLCRAIWYIKNGMVEEHHIWMLRNAVGGMFVAFERAMQLVWFKYWPSQFCFSTSFVDLNNDTNQPAYILAVSFWSTGVVSFVGMELYLLAKYNKGMFVHTVHRSPFSSIGSVDGATSVLYNTHGAQELTVAGHETVGDGSVLLSLQLGCKTAWLHIPVGGHVNVRLHDRWTTRSYSPVPLRKHSLSNLGFIHLLIRKLPTGALSPQLCDSVSIGDKVTIEGPFSSGFQYHPNTYAEIGMVAGGSGLAPMLNLMHAVLTNPQDDTKLVLVYTCRTKEDLLLENEIRAYMKDFPDQITVYFSLSREAPDDGYVGRVDCDLLAQALPVPVSYTHLRAHETPEHLVCRLLLEKKKKTNALPTFLFQ
eukprot:TRINITY_DN13159_c0_g1_i4.p1 TRINITY_DN13159_c0_g1~~TRINITY_DN13159_c0_g1_i4.p1  ORF type:complete len:560 (-),score=91.07 TRINITY_DN13159_c0_g1_i4:65-1744(-)